MLQSWTPAPATGSGLLPSRQSAACTRARQAFGAVFHAPVDRLPAVSVLRCAPPSQHAPPAQRPFRAAAQRSIPMPKLTSFLIDGRETLVVRADVERITHALGNTVLCFLVPLSFLLALFKPGQGLHLSGQPLAYGLLLLLAGIACRRFRDRLLLDRRSRRVERIRSLDVVGFQLVRPLHQQCGFDEVAHVSHLSSTTPHYSGVFVRPVHGDLMAVGLPPDGGLAPVVARVVAQAIGVPVRDPRVRPDGDRSGTVLSAEALVAMTQADEALRSTAPGPDAAVEVRVVTLWARLPWHRDVLLCLIPLLAVALGAMLAFGTSLGLPPATALVFGAAGLIAWGIARRAVVRRQHVDAREQRLRVDAEGILLPSVITRDGRAERVERARIARVVAQWSYARRTRSDRSRRAIDMGNIVLQLDDGSERVLSMWRVPAVETLAALQGTGYPVTQSDAPTPVLAGFRWAVVVAGCVMLLGGLWLLWPQIKWAFGS